MAAAVLMNQDEALALAFPQSTEIKRETVFLKPDQISAIQNLAKSKLDSELLTYYEGFNGSQSLGVALFDTHLVRSMPETLMVVLRPDGLVRFVEILAFHEPMDYKPPKNWLKQFDSQELNAKLWVKRGIRNIAGATLSTTAITQSVRRAMASYEVILKSRGTK